MAPCSHHLIYTSGISPAPFCHLCFKSVCTTGHIQGAFKVALKHGRVIYCHNLVLETFLSSVHTFLSSYSVSNLVTENKIKFVKAGSRVLQNCKKNMSLLNLASDQTVLSDLDSTLVIPHFIV